VCSRFAVKCSAPIVQCPLSDSGTVAALARVRGEGKQWRVDPGLAAMGWDIAKPVGRDDGGLDAMRDQVGDERTRPPEDKLRPVPMMIPACARRDGRRECHRNHQNFPICKLADVWRGLAEQSSALPPSPRLRGEGRSERFCRPHSIHRWEPEASPSPVSRAQRGSRPPPASGAR